MAILAGDIGGTKVHLALFKEGERQWFLDEKFPSNLYKSLEEIVAAFLSKHKQKVEKACFGVAGPVQKGRCFATNLPWVIESTHLAKVIGIKTVFLLNDLEANAYGIGLLKPDELLVINSGEENEGNAALIAAGTGLGEAGLYWDGKRHLPFACEGGHASYAPENEFEVELWRFLKEKFGHVSYERILSGPGLISLYQFLVEKKGEKANEQIYKAQDPAREISRLGMEGSCATCAKVLRLFVDVYGSESGNLCLKILAVGGLYIGGGIAPKLSPLFRSGTFTDRMISKGRFAPLLAKIPVRLILNENTALMGAAAYAR
jgi:glucokinase